MIGSKKHFRMSVRVEARATINYMNQKNKKINLKFSKNFLWGASISTHQVEGGNHNQWTRWELENAKVLATQAQYHYEGLEVWDNIKVQASTPKNYVSGTAADHFNRYESDFQLAKQLHMNALRSGIEWSRIEPEQGVFDDKALQHYKDYFSKLRDLGITPIVTLWHWTFPTWFDDMGGFEKRKNIKYFTRYIQHIADAMGKDFQYVITINEPTVYTTMSYHEEKWPPAERSRLMTTIVLLNLAKAHRKSYGILKKANKKMKVGLAHNCAYFYAGDNSRLSRISAWLTHRFGNEFFINRVKRHQDFFGLNYYFAKEFHGTVVHNPHHKTNDLGWDMQPDKVGPLMEQLYTKYKLPILISENGLADMHDKNRQWWIAQTVKAMDGAQKSGVEMIGYIHWSLLDNFEWSEGFWPRFGLVEIDYKTQKRTIRKSAHWYGRLIKTLS